MVSSGSVQDSSSMGKSTFVLCYRDLPGSSSGKRRAATALEGSDSGGKRRRGVPSPDENAQPANGIERQHQQRVFGKPTGPLTASTSWLVKSMRLRMPV